MDGIDQIVDVLGMMVDKTDARLGEMVRKMGYEFRISSKRESVSTCVGEIEGLTQDEKLIAGNMLVKRTDVLEYFFTLSMDDKKKYIRLMLDGELRYAGFVNNVLNNYICLEPLGCTIGTSSY
ncbi:hypothetical protein BUALT_Bualt03G0229200 [Buddleja alternifolia]|uniref:Uncharacterized protein n=1 Tax=Buddleja alternifolia TaxID=168488 RepID=A0AAV6Y2K3_9LAMI|nr:hypothetical protein BUALT_Bualt03G0229200 [Buddleja alternifolia]